MALTTSSTKGKLIPLKFIVDVKKSGRSYYISLRKTLIGHKVSIEIVDNNDKKYLITKIVMPRGTSGYIPIDREFLGKQAVCTVLDYIAGDNTEESST